MLYHYVNGNIGLACSSDPDQPTAFAQTTFGCDSGLREALHSGITVFQVDYQGDSKVHSAYSDRLWGWDHKKHDCLCQKHWNNRGQYWHERTPKEISSFLSDYYGKKCTVVKIVLYENAANGYPVWNIFWTER